MEGKPKLSQYSILMEKVLRIKLAAELGEDAIVLQGLSACEVCFVTLAVTSLLLKLLDPKASCPPAFVASEFLEAHFDNWFQSLCLYLSDTSAGPLPVVLDGVSAAVAELEESTGQLDRLCPLESPEGEKKRGGNLSDPSPDLEVKQSCSKSGVRFRILTPPTPKSRSPFRVLRQWYQLSILQSLIAEFCSLPSRIRFVIHVHKTMVNPVRKGQAPLELELYSFSGSDTCKDAYMRDMEQLRLEHPFLTYADLLILDRAWIAGHKSNDHTYMSCTQDKACESRKSEGGNLMPPLGVQQDSKHDQ